jgi:hypothetical protein
MSVDTLTLLDDVDWIATRAIYPEIDHTVISIIRYVAWRQGDKPPFAMYISQVDLLKHTGFGKSNFYENLEIAIKHEFVTRLIRGSNTNSTRAHYRINENRISQCPKIEKKVRYSGQSNKSESAPGDRTVRSNGVHSPVGETRLSGIDDPKRHERQLTTTTTSNVIKNINYERFNKILNYIPSEYREFIKPGVNYEKQLNELERKGTSLETVGAFLAKQNWYSSPTKGGLLSHFLDVLLGVKQPGERSHVPSKRADMDAETLAILQKISPKFGSMPE